MPVGRYTGSTTAGGDVPTRDEYARPFAERRISKHGNSLSFAIPRPFMRNLALLPGDIVRVVLYEESGGFFVQPIVRRAQLPPIPASIVPPVDPTR